MSSEHRTKNQHFGLFKGVRWVIQYTKDINYWIEAETRKVMRQGHNRKYLFKIYDFSKAKLSKVKFLKNAFLQNLKDLHRATTFLLVTLLHR